MSEDDMSTKNSLETQTHYTDQVKNEENELLTLKQYIQEREERIQLKLELRSKNDNVDAIRSNENFYKRLDSSIKKITSFIKRLKNFTESQKDSLAREMLTLNLSKYLSEVAAAFTEAKLKMNDIPCALHLCSLMHQYYADFSATLFELWQKCLIIKRDERVANPSKLRVDLRFFAELITIGILPQKESLSLLGNQLTILTTYDKEHTNVSIITSFCKHCGEDFADLRPFKIVTLADKYKMCVPRNSIFTLEKQKAVQNLFKEYFKSLCERLLTDHKEVLRQDRQNRKMLQTKGELAQEKKEKYDQMVQSYVKMLQNTELLADLLGDQMPDLPQEELSKKDEDGCAVNIDVYQPSGRTDDFDSSTSPWEDEETRQFYECFPDLKSLIPGILFKDSEKTSTQVQEDKKQEEVCEDDTLIDADLEFKDIEDVHLKEEEDIKPAQLIELDEIGDEEGVGSATLKAIMDVFITQLPNCVNRELIDKASKDFCMNLNTKTNRKRLVNALFQVQRTRLDLLPFYSRLVATLNPCMPEVGDNLASLLKNDFRFHVRKKDQINIESKIKNVRFIGELTKFKMFSKSEALNCLKTLLGDLKHHNIEMTCNLIETCGRFLYRTQDTHQRMKLMLEILMRKKQALAMDNRYTIMIENAFYYCNPPENKQIEKKIRIPQHEYIKRLLSKELNKLTVERVLRQMRRIDWNNDEMHDYAVKCLILAHNVKYNAIHCLANLVSGLASYHEEIGIQVVDGVLEDIRLGLEINQPKYNQRRISMVKYLGELYNFRLVESSIIFKTLYTILTYAVEYDLTKISDLDPSDNYFRIRLVCTLLETCGEYFDRGNSKKKLDCFLNYFQRYFLFKKELLAGEHEQVKQFPLEVEYVYKDTMQMLRPAFKFAANYQQACDQVNDMEKEIRDSLNKVMPDVNSLEVIEENQVEEEEQVKIAGGEEEGENQGVENEYEEEYDEYRSSDEHSTDQEQVVVLQSRTNVNKALEDDEFEKAFDMMLAENISQRAKESFKIPNADIALPMNAKNKLIEEEEPQQKQQQEKKQFEDKKFNFIFMTKRGNKPQFHKLDVPVSSQFANQFKAREEAEKLEKEKLKQLTLNINQRIEQEELQEMIQSMNQTFTGKHGGSQSLASSFNNVSTNSTYAMRDQRKQKYNHPKGAPDASALDMIFGNVNK